MPEYRRYNITLRVVDPSARDKFRGLSRPESFFEIRPGRSPGQRGAYSVEMTQDEYEAALEDMANPESNLIHIAPVVPSYLPSVSNDVPGQTAMEYVAAHNADSLGLTGEGVTVGLVDTGLDGAVADSVFSGRIKAAKGFSVYGDSPNNLQLDPYTDLVGHGTRMAALAVPPAAQAAVAKADSGSFESGDNVISAAVYWLADEVGIDIMLIEKQLLFSNILGDAVAHVVSKNIIVVTAMGNGGAFNDGSPGQNIAVYPAATPGALAISNYAPSTDAIDSTSNYGSHTWAAGPGSSLNWNVVGGGVEFTEMGGTSAASAIATGVVARFMTGGRSPGNVVTYLADNARPTGASPVYEGNGVLHLAAAEQELQQDKPEKIDLNGDPMEGSDEAGTGVGQDGTGNPSKGACG